MRLRGTFLLAAVALGLGLFVWLLEVRAPAKRALADEAAGRVFDVAADEIIALGLPLEDGGSATLVRRDGWRLTAPLEFPADPRAVERALGALEALEVGLTIEEPAEDLAVFGLSEQEREVVSARTSGATLELYLGGDTPIGSARYFAVAGEESRVHTAERAALEPLSSSLFGLRDKRMTTLVVEEVSELQVRVQGSLIVTAVRTEDTWKLSAPRKEAADSRRIKRLLEDLVLARAVEFIDSPQDLARYGLALPELQVSLARESGGPTSFELGSSDGTGYVRVDGGDVLYAVPERLLSRIPRTFFAYRYKRVLELEQADVRRIELRFPRADVVQSYGRSDSEWAPEGDAPELEPFAIEDLLFAVRSLDATEIERPDASPLDFGLDPPSLRVSAFDADGEVLGWLELGDILGESLSARSSQSERIWRVASQLGEDLPLGQAAFQNRFVAE